MEQNKSISNQAECCSSDSDEENETSLSQIIISGIIFAAALLTEHLRIPFLTDYMHKLISLVLYLVSYMICGRSVVIGAVKKIAHKDFFSEQFLMSIASIGAVCIGQYPEAVAVMLFYQIGEYFQDYALDKSRGSINALMEINPDKATVIRSGLEIEVRSEEVETGETIIVRPGERIPIDGVVIKGKSFIDNSALTGETVPLEILEGAEVFSGAINTAAVIEIKTCRPAGESAAARILELVEQSSSRKAKTERFITRFSRIYTPAVCGAALILAAVPSVITQDWNTWIYRALMFLIVSCPCALVISIPLSFFGGIGASCRQGILVKGSNSIEALARTKTAVFDKTGTLTKGVFVITAVHCAEPDKIPPDALLAIAAHAEIYSTHPVSKSLKAAHCGPCCSLAKITEAQEISGEGIQVNLDGKTVLAGNYRLMQNKSVSGYKQCPENECGTIVHIAVDGEYAGHIVISDEIKDDAVEAIAGLKKLGVNKIVMLTGDTESAAQKTADEIGITEVCPQLLPGDKVAKVEELISQLDNGSGKSRNTLIFAGDGINDAPVLARADVGIAMGALGTDAAIESADVVIMTDEPAKITAAIKTARRTVNIVHQNIIFSLAVKAAIMVFGATGLTDMWFAVFGDVGVTFIAVINAMRLLAVKKTAVKQRL